MAKVGSGTLLIVGGSGELGTQTVRAASSTWNGEVLATYFRSEPSAEALALDRVKWTQLDCGDHKAMRALIRDTAGLSAVVYCAVPKHGGAAGAGGDTIRNGIVEDVVAAAEAGVMVGARFVAVSTDLVFDGKLEAGRAYDEDAATCPPNPYGKYKEEMERRVLEMAGAVVVARTSLILTVGGDGAPHGKGVQFVMDAISGKLGEIELFTDELRNMSFSDDLGGALVELAARDCPWRRGAIHVASDEPTNRWELAQLLARRFGHAQLLGVHARSGLSARSGLDRPLNCALATARCRAVLRTRIRGVSERLA